MEASPEQSNKVLLIDLDNCPSADMAQLPNVLWMFKRIIGCSGPQEPRIPLSLAKALATPLHQGSLELVKMPRGGKNAADFGLAFMAGRLLAEMPADTEFMILSEDSDLDHVVDMLRAAQRKAKRVSPSKNPNNSAPSPIAELAPTPPPSPTPKPVPAPAVIPAQKANDAETLAYSFWESRLHNRPNRPASKATLLSAINAAVKTTAPGKAPAVVECLQHWKILTIGAEPACKISYTGKLPPPR